MQLAAGTAYGLLAHEQPESRSARSQTEERLEDAALVGGRHAAAAVAHPDTDVLVTVDLEVDGGTARARLDSVEQQIDDRLLQVGFVDAHP
jgi:hypothetical protein